MSLKKSLSISLAIIFTIFSSTPFSFSAGRSPTSAVNTILNGKGIPKSTLGINGDFYIDTRSLLIYGPKTKNKWPAPKSIQGPTGPSGSDGKNGSDGKTISNASTNATPGARGEQGLPGPQGERGEAGAPGAQGPSGPAGPAGTPGANGSNGANGSQGATGPQGEQGQQGPAGPAGLTGAQGETGTVGPSEVTVIDIPAFTLASSAEYSFISSGEIGSLVAGKNYYFNIYLIGSSDLYDLILGADVISTGNILKFDYVRTSNSYATYSTALTSYRFQFTGTVQVGMSDSHLKIRIINGRDERRPIALSLTGRAYITLVGAIK